MKSLSKNILPVAAIIVAIVVGSAIVYKNYIKSPALTASDVANIEPAAGAPAADVVAPMATAPADAGGTDAVQGTTDATTAPKPAQ